MLLESSQIPGELQWERESPWSWRALGFWLGLEPLSASVVWLPINPGFLILGKELDQARELGLSPSSVTAFCATLSTPAKTCFYRKSLHIHDQLQDIFNKKKNVCNAETFSLPLNCSSAQQWEIPRALSILSPNPKQHLSESVSAGFRISPPGPLEDV